jgi:ornithine cyclodeaminase/alanine dehydrogenase-like protein (mu-crystallin family)
MARTYAMGFAAVRPIKTIKAYSPTSENLRAYCEEMTRKLQIEVLPQENAESVIKGSDIVAACTNSMDPVIHGRWLEPGMYVTNTTNWELDEEVFQRITVVGQLLSRSLLDVSKLVDDNFELRMNVMAYVAGQPDERDRIPTPGERQVVLPSATWVPCVDWVTETPLGRKSDEDICLLAELVASTIPGAIASAGIQGLLFAAVAGRAYELAEAQGAGREMPLDLFLQDIPT